MDATTAPAAARESLPVEIEVTLRSPEFDDFAFRATEAELANAIGAQVVAARAATAKRRELAAIDKAQADLQQDIADADQRIAAATLLKDGARVERETEAKGALQESIARLAAQRASLA